MQPLPVPDGVWQDLSLDFVEGLPKSDGYSVILVVVDRFSKYAHFFPLKHPFTALIVVYDGVVKLHGLPKTMVSDRDKIFTSRIWTELFKLVGVKLLFSTAYHPQTDGQTERVNQCLEMYLRCAVGEEPKQWKTWLSQAELWYNTNFHTTLGCTPFKALYGYDPNLGISSVVSEGVQDLAEDFLVQRAMQFEALKTHLLRAQNRMKMYADTKRTEASFQVGDKVLLKLQPYVQSSLVNRPYPKLAMKYFGPYTILEWVGSVAYKLDLPASSAIHPTFHISQLKPFVPDHTPIFSDLPEQVSLDVQNVQPEEILDRRMVKKGNKAIPQMLIKWTSIPATPAT